MRKIIAIIYLISISLAVVQSSLAVSQNFTDKSAAFRTDTYTYDDTVSGNNNYYDGDFADYDGDGLIDRMLISRWGLLLNINGQY